MSDGKDLIIRSGEQLLQPKTRRGFLKMLAVGGSVIMLPSVFTACNDDNYGTNAPGGTTSNQFSLNLSNDLGILNYAYALEQLEAAFYTAALTSPGYTALSGPEQEVISDLQKHEVIHREFLKTALGTNAIPTITFNTATVASLMTSRANLLSTSQLLEDTGVSAYNGAGKYLTSATYLLLAGKIVSVEARHAAAIRDIRDGTNGVLFAGDDVVDSNGLDVKAEPSTVLASVVSLNVVNTTASPLGIGTPPDAAKKTADKTAPTPT